VLTNGDQAEIARRLSEWLIYTHPQCPPKAVRGWLAVQRAERIQEKPNTEAFREAAPYVLFRAVHTCVCILDDEHIEAELSLADYDFSDETTMPPARKRGDTDDNQNETEADEAGEDELLPALYASSVEHLTTRKAWEEIVWECCRKREEIIWACRRESYATCREAPEQPPSPVLYSITSVVRRVTSHSARKIGFARRSQNAVLTRDALGVPVERALYSRKPIIEDAGEPVSELDLRIRYEAERAKPRPVDLGYDSGTNPERYEWKSSKPRKGLPPIRTAILKREWLDEKRAAEEMTGYLLGCWIMCGARTVRSDTDVFYRGVTRQEGDLYKRYWNLAKIGNPSPPESRSETRDLGPKTESVGEQSNGHAGLASPRGETSYFVPTTEGERQADVQRIAT